MVKGLVEDRRRDVSLRRLTGIEFMMMFFAGLSMLHSQIAICKIQQRLATEKSKRPDITSNPLNTTMIE
jgi:hypothetical protein